MGHDEFGNECPLAPVPLETELNVGAAGTAVFDGVGFDPHAPPLLFAVFAVPQLGKADGDPSIGSGPAGSEWEPFGDDDRVGVAVRGQVGPARLDQLSPLGFAADHEPVEAVNFVGFDVGPLQILSERPGQNDISINVHDIGIEAQLLQASLNHASLTKWSIAHVIFRDKALQSIFAAHFACVRVGWRGDHDPVVEVFGVPVRGFCQEIGISDARRDGLNAFAKHGLRGVRAVRPGRRKLSCRQDSLARAVR